MSTNLRILAVGGCALVWLLTVALPAAAQPRVERCFGAVPTLVYIGYEGLVQGTEQDDVIWVDGGWNWVVGGGGDDRICVVGHFNALLGETGDDQMMAFGMHNRLHGGLGDDQLMVDSATSELAGDDGADLCNGDPC